MVKNNQMGFKKVFDEIYENFRFLSNFGFLKFCETTSGIFFDGPGGSNSLEIARFVLFRMSRYGLKKSH